MFNNFLIFDQMFWFLDSLKDKQNFEVYYWLSCMVEKWSKTSGSSNLNVVQIEIINLFFFCLKGIRLQTDSNKRG